MCVDMDATTLNFLLKDKPIIYIFSYLGKIRNTLIQRLMGKDPFPVSYTHLTLPTSDLV